MKTHGSSTHFSDGVCRVLLISAENLPRANNDISEHCLSMFVTFIKVDLFQSYEVPPPAFMVTVNE